ncbi:MAG: methyltransferase domain-containing protein [Actinomycetota bacterium]|nr:methyltransferase domain-containing protein [Actinomycetota bacterium]
MDGWTREQLRHVGRLWRFSSNPAATVYDSIGADFFLAPAPGWLNLGLWQGAGDEAEAAVAPRRLVEVMAARLPRGGVVLDVGNGLGVQDPVIAEVAMPHALIAINITESQLRAGRSHLADAGVHPVVADATRIPLGDGSVDAVISVEAAFHFPSRPAFFAEVRRVLRPGGRLVMSDISTERLPRTPGELLAGATSLRFWGLRLTAAASAATIRQQAADAGLIDVRVERIGHRVFEPMLRWAAGKVQRVPAPRSQRLAARLMLAQWSLLRRRGLLDYILLEATAAPPASAESVA